MTKTILYKDYFKILYDEVFKKFRATVEKNGEEYPSSIRQEFGFIDKLENYDEKKPNLKKYIIEDDGVKNHFGGEAPSINGKYFYDRFLEYKNTKKQKITFAYAPYTSLFFVYAGYKDVSDFINKHNSKEKFKKQKALILGAELTEPTPDSSQYICYYYSYKYHSVRNFDLWIDYEMQPVKFKGNEFLAKETGLHDASSDSQPNSDIYIGKAKEKSGFLYINLVNQNQDRGDELNIIANIGNRPAKTKKVFLGSYQGVSIDTFVINAACLIVEKNWNANLSEKEIEMIERYLYMQRKNFRVRTFDGDSLTALKITNRYPVNRINLLVGRYRVWNKDRGGNIIQSEFVIEKNYESWLVSIITDPLDAEIEGFQKQVCLLNIHDDYVRKLFVSSHLKIRTGITNYAIIDIPVRKRDYLEGVFCSIGFDEYSPAIGTDIVLMRDGSDFEIKQFDKEEIVEMIGKDKKLKKMDRILNRKK